MLRDTNINQRCWLSPKCTLYLRYKKKDMWLNISPIGHCKKCLQLNFSPGFFWLHLLILEETMCSTSLWCDTIICYECISSSVEYFWTIQTLFLLLPLSQVVLKMFLLGNINNISWLRCWQMTTIFKPLCLIYGRTADLQNPTLPTDSSCENVLRLTYVPRPHVARFFVTLNCILNMLHFDTSLGTAKWYTNAVPFPMYS